MRAVDKIYRTLFYDELSRDEFQQVEAVVAEDNRRSGEDWAVSAGFFWLLSLFLSTRSSAYNTCRQIYGIALLFCIATFLAMRFLVKRVPHMISLVMYIFKLSVLGAGICIAVFQPDVRTCTMIAAAVIVPVAFIDRTITSLALQAAALAAYILLAKDVIVPDIYSWGLTNLLIFSTAGVMVGHVINKARYERYVYAESAVKLAEMQTQYAYYDQLTGLKNRRAYAEELQRLSERMPPDLCVVAADVNGLKKVNDTFGHEAGDDLIIGAAVCLSQAFGGIDTIYRVGGDEFSVILPRGGAENALNCLERLEELTENWNGRCFTGLSVSCGLASTRDYGDLDAIVREADSRMYESKRVHYEAVS